MDGVDKFGVMALSRCVFSTENLVCFIFSSPKLWIILALSDRITTESVRPMLYLPKTSFIGSIYFFIELSLYLVNDISNVFSSSNRPLSTI